MARTKDVKMARGKRNRVVVVVNKETAEREREEDVCTLRLSRVALDRVYGPCTVWPRPHQTRLPASSMSASPSESTIHVTCRYYDDIRSRPALMMRNHQTILLLRPGANIALASTLGAQERKHAGQQTI